MIFECKTDKMIIGEYNFLYNFFFFFSARKTHRESTTCSILWEARDLGEGAGGVPPSPPPPPVMTCGFLIQLVLVFWKKKAMWFIGVQVEQETSAPPPKKNSWIRPWLMTSTVIKPGSFLYAWYICQWHRYQIKIILTSSRSAVDATSGVIDTRF